MPFRSFTVLDPKFKPLFKRYVFQVSLATGALITVLLAEQRMSGAAAAQAVLVAAIASTAFVLFITPHTSSAGLRASLGGACLGAAHSERARPDSWD
jgi:hypothetical protein